MARSYTPTLLPLDRYAQLMGVRLAHFNNLYDAWRTDACHPYWTQAEHDELALAIGQAEEKLRAHLHFDIAPCWRTETIPFKPGAVWYDDWAIAPVSPSYGYPVAYGRQQKTLLADGASVTYSGGTAQITVSATGITDTNEIRVYYRAADGADAAGSDAWEIRPLRTVIGAGQLLISGPRPQFVRQEVREQETPADAETSGNYVSQVDVYRVTTDPALPVTLVWDAASGSDPSGSVTQTAAARAVDPITGRFYVRPATWDAVQQQHIEAPAAKTEAPERIEVAYCAGFRLGGWGRIDPQLEEAARRLTNVLLPERGIPFCDPATRKYKADREVDEQTGLMNGELFAVRVAEMRKKSDVWAWVAV